MSSLAIVAAVWTAAHDDTEQHAKAWHTAVYLLSIVILAAALLTAGYMYADIWIAAGKEVAP